MLQESTSEDKYSKISEEQNIITNNSVKHNEQSSKQGKQNNTMEKSGDESDTESDSESDSEGECELLIKNRDRY